MGEIDIIKSNCSPSINKIPHHNHHDEPWQIREKTLVQKYLYIFQNELYTDVTFLVGESQDRISCHKILLIIHSPVFESMLSRRWHNQDSTTSQCQQQQEISLPEEDTLVFKLFLNYIYTGEINSSSDVENLLSLLLLAKKYLCPHVTSAAIQVIKQKIRDRNVVTILHTAQMCGDTELEAAAKQYILSHAVNLLELGEFAKLSEDNLAHFLESDELNVDEVSLFNAVCQWGSEECSRRGYDSEKLVNEHLSKVLAPVLKLIRFTLMSPEEFTCQVVVKNVLPLEDTVQIYKYLSTPSSSTAEQELVKDLKFNTKDRVQKTFSYLFKRLKGHGYDFSRHYQNFCFRVDHDIELLSLGFFKAVDNSGVDVGIKMMDYDMTQTFAIIEETDMKPKDNSDVFHVKFPKPVKILKNVVYTISYILKGMETYYRTGGHLKIQIDCGGLEVKVLFEFLEATL